MTLFSNWLVRFLEKLRPKLHKKFLFLLKFFIQKNFRNIFSYTGAKGFKLVVNGKISVTGNAKTRCYRMSFGKSSFSKKSLHLSYSHGLVKTRTGVLGLLFILAY